MGVVLVSTAHLEQVSQVGVVTCTNKANSHFLKSLLGQPT